MQHQPGCDDLPSDLSAAIRTYRFQPGFFLLDRGTNLEDLIARLTLVIISGHSNTPIIVVNQQQERRAREAKSTPNSVLIS
jgi:hypothetical protein